MDTSVIDRVSAPPETIERDTRTLFITDAEMIRRMGVPEKIARDAIRMLDKNSTSRFPNKQKLWGARRYWPAVVAWLDLQYVRMPPRNRT